MLDDSASGGGRRPVRRTAAERAAIVAESYEPGATVAMVAQRNVSDA
jgi:transposase-like protein